MPHLPVRFLALSLPLAAGVAGAIGMACSSSSSESSGADSGPQGSPDASDATFSQPDASPPDAGPQPDGSQQEAAPPPLMCPATFPRWDGGLPDGALCSAPDDTDHDSYPDCIDGCPYDPYKIAPGVCGCNIPDIDTDGDGIPDCIDQCWKDPNNTRIGQCGCVAYPGFPLAPAGKTCTDPACPQTGATCDDAGVCGDRKSCVPCPGGRYVVSNDLNLGYWYCGGSLPPVDGPTCMLEDGGEGAPAGWMAAQSACAAKGLTLARIETTDENSFLAQLTTSPIWIGANDLQTPGQWYWSSATTNSDLLLWDGGVDGSRQNDLYTNWASGSPGKNSCAAMSLDGHWYDNDCTQPLAYLCQYLQ
jgi:Lectin C-type domain